MKWGIKKGLISETANKCVKTVDLKKVILTRRNFSSREIMFLFSFKEVPAVEMSMWAYTYGVPAIRYPLSIRSSGVA